MALTAKPAEPNDRVRIRLRATVANVGTADVGRVTVEFFAPGHPGFVSLGPPRRVAAALAPGETAVGSADCPALPAGARTVMARVSSQAGAEELRTDNNERELTLTVVPGPRPDLVIGEMELAFATTGTHRVVLKVTVNNVSEESATLLANMKLLSGTKSEDYFTGNLVESLPAGGSRICEVDLPPETWQSGLIRIPLTLDPDDRVEESDESNNQDEFVWGVY